MAIYLTIGGTLLIVLATIDWTTARVNGSERHYLVPLRVAREFCSAIAAALRGQNRAPSLRECTHWNRHASGPFVR